MVRADLIHVAHDCVNLIAAVVSQRVCSVG